MSVIITAHTQKDIDYILKYHLLKPMQVICDKLNITIDTYHHIIRVHGDNSKLRSKQ